MPKDNNTPWLIFFPEEQNNSHFKFFNPGEKERLYKTQDTGFDFSKSVCKATHGNWLLMQDLYDNLYIVNLFTNERFTLCPPPIEYQIRMTKVSTVFWIDDKTKDYVVLSNVDGLHVVYCSKKFNRY